MALIVTERNLAGQLRVASRRMVSRQLVFIQASDETVALLCTTLENLATAGGPGACTAASAIGRDCDGGPRQRTAQASSVGAARHD